MNINTDIVSLEQLRIEHEMASMEAFAGADALRQATLRLPRIFDSAKTFYAKFLGNVGAFMFKTKDLRDLGLKIERHSYVDTRAMDVMVPEGLNTDLLSYCQTLIESGEIALKLETDVLAPFEHWLAVMVGRPEELANLSSTLKIPNLKLHEIERCEKRILSCFVTHGRREHLVSFGKAFRRNSDVLALAKELERLETLFDKDAQKRIVELVNRSTYMMGELIQMIETEGKERRVSPATVRALSDTTYRIARELEHYGLLRYRMTELSNAVEETRKRIGTWLNYNQQ